MQMNKLSNISASSKKITKRSKNTYLVPKEAKPAPSKKYKTTKRDAKFELLDQIRRRVDPEFHNETWNKTVAKFKPTQYRALLYQLYPSLEATEIRSKWKNIKRMLNSIEKSDGRGGALLANEEERKEFKEHLKFIIKHKLKTKSFIKLRQHVLPKIEEIFAKNGRKIPDQPFQKHFWSYYHKAPKNHDIKEAWKKLKRTKPQNSLEDNTDSSFVSDMLEKSENGEDDVDESIPVFEEGGNGERNTLFEEEEVKDDTEVKFQKVVEEENDIENFFQKDFPFEGEGFSKEAITFEVPLMSFDNDIMKYFDKEFYDL